MKLSQNDITTIAGELEIGMNVYINRETYEIESIPDLNDAYVEIDMWKDQVDKIENEWPGYVIIEKMESREAFRVMERFIEEIGDREVKEYLGNILRNKRSFANFKAAIDSSKYRLAWIDFRSKQFIEYVVKLLDYEGFKIEQHSTEQSE